jgi:uncharacterized protein YggU (UPF0235/DUF167 family)
VKIEVTVKTGSKRPGIDVSSTGIVLRVRERAIEGAANEACVRALAEHFDVATSRVELLRGARARRKLFEVDV